MQQTSNFLPPSLLKKLKDFDENAPRIVADRASEIQDENHKQIERAAFRRGVKSVFSMATLRNVLAGMANAYSPFITAARPGSHNHNTGKDYRETVLGNIGETLNFDKIWPYWRQAINEYMDTNNFPRETLTLHEAAWLQKNPSQPLSQSRAQKQNHYTA